MQAISSNQTGLPRRGLFMMAAGALLVLPMGQAARAEAGSEAAAPVEQLNASLIAAMKAGGRISFAQRMGMLQPAVDQAFDLPAVLQASVGPRWTGLSTADQGALLAAFQRYTAANYAANFDSYENQAFQVLPQSRTLSDGRVVVQTRIARPGGTEHKIDYVMRRTPQGWKAVDVLADGSISRVAVQRSDFAAALASGGASGLASRLSMVTSSLAAGAGGNTATYG